MGLWSDFVRINSFLPFFGKVEDEKYFCSHSLCDLLSHFVGLFNIKLKLLIKFTICWQIFHKEVTTQAF